MRRYTNIIILLSVILLILLTSCGNKELENQIACLDEQVKELSKQVTTLKQEKLELEKIINEQNRIEDELNYRWLYDEKFSWLKNREWDKVTISHSVTGETLDITENELFNKIEISRLFGYLEKDMTFPNPSYKYIYEFNIGDVKHTICVRNSEVMFIDDDCFECPRCAYQLGEALLKPIYLKNINLDSLLYKTYNSSLIADYDKESIPIFVVNQKWRIEMLSDYVHDEMKLIEKLPDDNLVKIYNLTMFYYGEEIKFNIYNYNGYDGKYVEIIQNDKSEIYEQKENLMFKGEKTSDKAKCIYSIFGIN